MNKKQIKIILVGLALIIVTIVIWQLNGGETLTKTKILVEKTDELFGHTYMEWEDKFIFGLLPSEDTLTIELLSVVSISGLVILMSAILLFLYRTKKTAV